MIVFLSCGKTKAKHTCKACEMYQGDLFKKSFEYAKKLNPRKIYILSAKYKLLELDDIISPYELTLKKVEDINDFLKNTEQKIRLPKSKYFSFINGISFKIEFYER